MFSQACGNACSCRCLPACAFLHEQNPDKWKCQLSKSARHSLSNLKPSGNLARNCPPVFISDTLLSIFNEAATGVTSGESALWEGEMKESYGEEGRRREASHRSLSLSPMNVAQVRSGTSTKELYIADKWRGLHGFLLILPLSKAAWALQVKSATAAVVDPLEGTQVMEIEYMKRVMYDECAPGYKTKLRL